MPSKKPDPKPPVVNRLGQEVEEVLERAGLRGKRLVVAVSGGPDSLALLHILAGLRSSLGLALHVAHLDHGLRPEAAADARFVQDAARGLELPVTAEQADVLSYRQQRRLSLEQAAREVRYAFLARVAQAVGAQAVALGHTANDQAETVLLHLLRGSGLVGLRGMRPLSSYRAPDGSQVTLVRPLLSATREETEGYCQARGLRPRLDESNLEVRFLRNRLRLKVLPLLRQVNPSVREALLRLSRAADQSIQYLEGEVERLWPTAASATPLDVSLDRKGFQHLHAALQPLLLRRAYCQLLGDAEELTQKHLDGMMALMAGPAGKRMHLPRGLRLQIGYDVAHLGFDPLPPCPLPPLGAEQALTLPGVAVLDGWLVTAEFVSPAGVGGEHDSYVARVDLDAAGSPLLVRARQPGDRFQPLGMAESKKLQDFLVDAHVPREWRSRVPLVVSPKGVLWVVGWRIAHWGRVTPETRRVLRLSFRPTA